MKVTERRPDRLILENVPTGLVAFDLIMFVGGTAVAIAGGASGNGETVMGGVIVAAVFGVALIWHSRRTRVIFDAGSGEIHIRRRDLFGTTDETCRIEDVTCVDFEEFRSNDTGSKFRAVLKLSGRSQSVPLTMVYQKRSYAEEGAFAAQDWLRAHRERR